MSKSVWVYAHWHSMEQPELVGILEVDLVWGAEVAPYFQLSATQSKEILTELRSVPTTGNNTRMKLALIVRNSSYWN